MTAADGRQDYLVRIIRALPQIAPVARERPLASPKITPALNTLWHLGIQTHRINPSSTVDNPCHLCQQSTLLRRISYLVT